MAGKAEMIATLVRYRAEARCVNELEGGHLLYRLGQELGLAEAVLLRLGFAEAYRELVTET